MLKVPIWFFLCCSCLRGLTGAEEWSLVGSPGAMPGDISGTTGKLTCLSQCRGWVRGKQAVWLVCFSASELKLPQKNRWALLWEALPDRYRCRRGRCDHGKCDSLVRQGKATLGQPGLPAGLDLFSPLDAPATPDAAPALCTTELWNMARVSSSLWGVEMFRGGTLASCKPSQKGRAPLKPPPKPLVLQAVMFCCSGLQWGGICLLYYVGFAP